MNKPEHTKKNKTKNAYLYQFVNEYDLLSLKYLNFELYFYVFGVDTLLFQL